MTPLFRDFTSQPCRPEKVIQFGEGNFLRAFIDWQIDLLNQHTDFDAGITIVRPIDAGHPKLDAQGGIYTALVRGINEAGESVAEPRIITSVNRELLAYGEYEEVLRVAENPDLEWVVSNTTEAGICFDERDQFDAMPPITFPAKLTQFLYRRYQHFNGSNESGLILLPCELIDANGEKLKETVIKYAQLWQLDAEFLNWIETANTFCSTLVDRIVTGYPKDEIKSIEAEFGYQDNFLVAAEYFYLFVIQGPSWLNEKLNLAQCPLNIKIVDDIKPYKERKVGILNGAHTAMVPVAYLAGIDTVSEAMQDGEVSAFLDALLDREVIPSLDMDEQELQSFKDSVLDRFRNPYIKHYLISIALNSLTKFKTRLLPQLITYSHEHGTAPKHLSFSLAALYCFYLGKRGDEAIPLSDDQHLLEPFEAWRQTSDDHSENVRQFLAMENHWDMDLTLLPELPFLVAKYVNAIQALGMKEAMKQL
ncbi:altronate oxidoreductase [Vibrio ichthyoenteri ATCC 700023]|uniref:Altronate oxidoreductase n=1 Tax=Vibrio ichthyoenteri ATCC 700023 TaxID=870968 RepID=F9S7E6_9VIBR|nr:tagaturonate reductase [Vibrio ichthyoenteri]EGU31426.1 altronate oxidoreductase [Vibrio ichthyoenteri ATCC 700023]